MNIKTFTNSMAFKLKFKTAEDDNGKDVFSTQKFNVDKNASDEQMFTVARAIEPLLISPISKITKEPIFELVEA